MVSLKFTLMQSLKMTQGCKKPSTDMVAAFVESIGQLPPWWYLNTLGWVVAKRSLQSLLVPVFTKSLLCTKGRKLNISWPSGIDTLG